MSAQPTPAEVAARRQRFQEACKNEEAYLNLRSRLCERLKLPVATATDAQIIFLVDTLSEWIGHLPTLRKLLGIEMHRGISVIATIEHVVRKLRRLEGALNIRTDDGEMEAMAYKNLRALFQLPDTATVGDLHHVARIWSDDRRDAAEACAKVGIDIHGVSPWWVVAQVAGALELAQAERDGRTP